MIRLAIPASAFAALLALGCGSASGDLSLNAGLNASAAPPPPASSPARVAAPPPTEPPPPAQSGVAVIVGDRIQVNQRILYDTDKDQIAAESFPVLDDVANILNTHPEITALTVEGHTDNQGAIPYNIKLSERRSNAVVAYLAAKGVRQPMRAPGYGASSPVCHTDTDACRAQNRRVVFKITIPK